MDRPRAAILVVDDNAKTVRLVRAYLERDGFRVVEAFSGRSALAAIEAEAPALVVLDVMLPEVDGLAIARVVRRASRTPIVMVSARGTTADRIAGLAVGVDDYMAKPFSPAELVLRIRRVLERSVRPGSAGPQPRPIMQHGDLQLDQERREVSVAGRRVELTATAFSLLVAILGSGGRVLSRDQLMDAVYGEGRAEILDRSVDGMVRRLREKLGDDPERPRYVATVRGAGYRAARPDESPTALEA